MYDLTHSVEEASGNQLNQPQLAKLREHEEYLKKHKIHEILNVQTWR
jgi:hypothetical protein